ncbi:hypothetical protein C8R44DRAFT_760889 [Mycena epipterygia]|nr:hypothetical protein C8R44DRAFT_760889 [Mycena epipterygia]
MGSTMDFTYGAMFIGGYFQGVLTVQAYIYYESFPDDPRRLKILDVIHLVLICQPCYHYLITSWGNDAALLVSTTVFDLHLIFVGMDVFICQAFFIHRIWTFSKRNWLLTSVLGVASLVIFGLQIAITVRILGVPSVSYFTHQAGEIVPVWAIGSAAARDTFRSVCLLFPSRLVGSRYSRTNFVVGRIIQYTPSRILEMSSARSDVRQAMYLSLGRLYTNALLASLNSRRSLRLALQTQASALAFTAAMNTRVITTTTDGDDYQMGIRSPNPKDLQATPQSH